MSSSTLRISPRNRLGDALRNLTCVMMIAVVPASLMAADSGAAMLYAKGSAWLNGSAVPNSSAIFPGDLVQTKPNSMARINASGSNVMVQSDSLVEFQENAVSVEHGKVSVTTSKGMTTHAGAVTVAPSSNVWTEFDVTDVDGTVMIMARKGDVSINNGQDNTTLPQGQSTTVQDADQKKRKKRPGGAVPAGQGGILDSPWAIGIGAGAVGGVLTWVLIQGSDPASPSAP